MLELIKDLPETVGNIVEYTTCSAIEYIAKQLIMNRFFVSGHYALEVDKVSNVKDALSTVTAVPIEGDRWMVVVDIDKIGVADTVKFLNTILSTAIVVYITHNYKNYQAVVDSKEFKQQASTNYAVKLYLSKLTEASIGVLYNYYLLGKPKNFPDKLMKFVKKNYKYNPDLVCELFSKVKDGEMPKTEKDIIEMVGVGGNTPQALTVSLLTTTTRTEKGKKQFLKKNLMLFNDLSVKYSYDITYAYMISTLKGIIDIKELQISGKFFDFYQDIPDTYSEERKRRIQRLHRFESVILHRISLRRTLVLYQCMQTKSYDKQQAILQGIYQYVDRLGG